MVDLSQRDIERTRHYTTRSEENGISTDRVYATLVSNKFLSEKEQKELVDKFNQTLNSKRDEYFNLILTNYRDYNRKRIGFDFAYKLCSNILSQIED